jgi:thiamine monophosphate synthase
MLQQLLDDGITILQLRKRIRHEEQLERNASRS